jgi:virginiamycin B lyase
LVGTPNGMTIGPDGALWFAERLGNKIGRITTAGAISEFPLPMPDSGPGGITTAGPDGTLWFTEFLGNKIGRITATGEFSEFLLPTPNSGPFGITVGSDGAVWFTETRGNKIGRLTTTEEFSEFPLPMPNDGRLAPVGITVGSDGAVWFTERDKIGRIGHIDEDVKADVQTFHWERWILSLATVASLGIIIAGRLKRLHLH